MSYMKDAAGRRLDMLVAPPQAADLYSDGAPRFIKPLTSPMVVAPDPAGSKDDAYWPWVVNARAVLGSGALDNYYMYTSSDHDLDIGGIYLRTGPTPYGPWTQRGEVFHDAGGGYQTETGSVVWNPETGLWHMYYQQVTQGVTGFTAGQSTGLATSPDGVTWTRVGIVLTTPNQVEVMGAGQLTYFRVFRIGGRWFGYHLYASGDQYRSGMSFSEDGINWVTDRQQLGNGPMWASLGGRGIAWHMSSIVMWRGNPWLIGFATSFVSGGSEGVGDSRIFVAPLSTDYRRLTAAPKIVLNVSQPWESVNLRGLYAFVDGGHIHVYYQCDKPGALPSIGYATTKGA